MIKSIRYFLLVSLLLSITVASAINGIGNYVLDEKVVQPYLDSQLTRLASVVDLLGQSTYQQTQVETDIIKYLFNDQPVTKEHFLFQVWNQDGELLLASSNEYKTSLHHVPLGFSDHEIKNKSWRIYAVEDSKLKTKIIVGELQTLRRELADDIARSNANILLVTYPVFGLLVWFIISFALRSIRRVANEISNRASTYLEPVQLEEIPEEIKPLVAELNQLFIRLKSAFERNKRFSADAAHELRTPLAALKAHVEVALKTSGDQEKNKALQKVIEGVNRSSHVVAQLLTLSRLGDEEGLSDIKPIHIHKLAIEIIAYLAPSAFDKHIEIELNSPPKTDLILGNRTAIEILMRNIIDNAIRYTPENGEVFVSVLEDETHIIFRVIDTGTGIPSDLYERVFERFYRILGTKASGSGLGLAIVKQITDLHHGTVHLSTPANGIGLQFDVAFPKYRA